MTKEEAKEVLELMDIVEEQQLLIRLLLDTYPAETQEVKQQMLAISDSIQSKVKNYRNKATSVLEQSL